MRIISAAASGNYSGLSEAAIHVSGKIPNAKLQSPNKSQIANPKLAAIDHWNFFGLWNFGVWDLALSLGPVICIR